MKNIMLTLVILFTSISCKAQLGAYLNNINDTELFDGIKFNNVSLGDIMVASGDLTKMKDLFGNNIQKVPNNSGPYIGKELYNGNIVFGFEDETDTGNNYDLTDITIRNSSVIVNVKGLSIRIGDDKSKFGSYLFNPNSNSYNFTDADTGSVGLSFQIDSITNKVTEIKFIAY
jgi:hypothetical protein